MDVSKSMKQVIIGISLLSSVAFLGLSVVSTYEIFRLLIDSDQVVRAELWIFLILCFTGGVILLSIAWGIAELTESRQMQRELKLNGLQETEKADEY